MGPLPTAAFACLLLLLTACVGTVADDPTRDPAAPPRPGPGSASGPPGSASSGPSAAVGGPSAGAGQPAPQGAGAPPGSTTPGAAGAAGAAGPAGAPAPCNGRAPAGAPPRLWRLSAAQYRNTVAALLSGRAARGTDGLVPPTGVPLPFADVNPADRFSTFAASYAVRDTDLPEVMAAAEAVAARLTERLMASSCLARDTGFEACLTPVVGEKAALLFSRPATAAEVQRYVALGTYALERVGRREAVQAVFEALLMAPSFLYRTEIGAPSTTGRRLVPHEIAAAIAYALTDGPPDEPLWRAATTGALAEGKVIAEHVARLADPLPRNASVARFLLQAFGLGARPIAKDDPRHRPEALLGDTQLFIEDVLATASRRGFLQALLTTRTGFVRRDTAWNYGATSSSSTPAKTTFGGDRVGILGQPSWLAAFSQSDHADPIKRGKFIREELLCQPVPPVNIEQVPDLSRDPKLTMRQKLALHVENPSCRGCHALMDPIGLPLEGFDHLGRERTTEAGQTIDRSGALTGTDREEPFEGLKGLAERLAASRAFSRCFVESAFEAWLGRLTDEGDECSVNEALSAFEDKGGDLVALLQSLFSSRSFLDRKGG